MQTAFKLKENITLKLKVNDEIFDAAKKELPSYVKEHVQILKAVQAGEDCYKDSLGWYDTSVWAGDEIIDKIESIAAGIRIITDVFVLIGVGGSNNAARSVIEAISPDGGTEIIYAGNTISPNALNRVIKMLEGKEVYINCIAKNFETLEPGVSFRILRQYLVNRYGKEEAAKRIICTGTNGSSLDKLCRDNGYAFVPFPTNIGGRYTALSYVGLLPMAVAGIDIRSLVKGGKDMESSLRHSPAKKTLRCSMLRCEIFTFQRAINWSFYRHLNLNCAGFTNGGSSSSLKAKAKKVSASSLSQANSARSCILLDNIFRTEVLSCLRRLLILRTGRIAL